MNRLKRAAMSRWRRWLSRRPVGRARVRALAVLVVTGAAAVVLAALSHQAWPPVVLTILFTVPSVYLAWPAESSSAPATAAAGILGRGGPVAQWDVRHLGVHAAISVPGVADEVPPEYVPRDVDTAEFGVRALVAAAAERGGFVLLVGGSSVGKSRSAAQAVRALLPDWWLVHPDTPGEVAALAAAPSRQLVVWLDELQHYLDGKNGMTAGVVRALMNPPHPAVVIGTLWPDLYTGYIAVPAPGGSDPHGRERQLLDLADVVRIEAAFTDGEQARARAAAARDARLKVALDTAGYGLTQTLAGAPELVARWQDAQAAKPYAWAVLTAALDAARLGARAPLSGDFLRAAAPGYLTSQQQAEAPQNWFKQALKYAQRKVLGAAAALTPAGAGIGQVAGYTPADYLIQHASRKRRCAHVPASTWDAILSHIRDPADATRLAAAARNRLFYHYAILLYRRAAAAGDVDAATELAGLLAKRGGLAELRALAGAGIWEAAARLAGLLAARGDLDEAAQVLRSQADTDDSFAHFAAFLLSRLYGDLDEAAQVLRSQADTGGQDAARWLAGLLADKLDERGDLDELVARRDADYAASIARDIGLTDAPDGTEELEETEDSLLTEYLDEQVDSLFEALRLRHDPGGLDELRSRADVGDADAAMVLADLLAERDDLDGLRARVLAGDSGHLYQAEHLAKLLTDLLKKQGQTEKAEQLRRFGLSPDGSIASA